jgi:hypothetical protein
MVGDIQKTIDNIDDIQKQMLSVTAESWSSDRMVRVTVGPRGQLIDLELDPRIYRRPNSKALAASIVATVREAVEEATRRTTEIMERNTPSDIRAPLTDSTLGKILQTPDAELKDVMGDEWQ